MKILTGAAWKNSQRIDFPTNGEAGATGPTRPRWRMLKASHRGKASTAQMFRPLCRVVASLCLVFLSSTAPAQAPGPQRFVRTVAIKQEPITPVPQPPVADELKLRLGERLFEDRRLSHDGTLSCWSCHDLRTNGADDERRQPAPIGSKPSLTTLSVFNAALSFRLNWEGNFRTLEAQAQSSLENPANLNTNADEVLGKLQADPTLVSQFTKAYGHGPDKTTLLDAIATFERSLLTPGSRFDRWLTGDTTALSEQELSGYRLFKSLGCVSCHQGVNIGGNLYERHGIFGPIGSPDPEILRVPSLRNVATVAPYFHDGSAATLDDAVRRMAAAQLDVTLSDDQIKLIIGFLKTLTGTFHGKPLAAP
jgi:cytochrome c peroxidase